MKRIVCLSLILILLLCGCGAGKEIVPALTVESVVLTPESSVEEVLATLGNTYEYYEAISCVYDGMDKTYDYGDYVLYAYPQEDGDHLMELYCTGGDVSAAGITFGSTRDEVIQVWGDGYTMEGSVLTYCLNAASDNRVPASIYFELTDDCVTAMAVTAEHRAE